MAYFCEKTGVRIAKPGVSKAVDPDKGHDEVVEVDGELVHAPLPLASKSAEKPADKPADKPKK